MTTPCSSLGALQQRPGFPTTPRIIVDAGPSTSPASPHSTQPSFMLRSKRSTTTRMGSPHCLVFGVIGLLAVLVLYHHQGYYYYYNINRSFDMNCGGGGSSFPNKSKLFPGWRNKIVAAAQLRASIPITKTGPVSFQLFDLSKQIVKVEPLVDMNCSIYSCLFGFCSGP